jgi:hypothetical protein
VERGLEDPALVAAPLLEAQQLQHLQAHNTHNEGIMVSGRLLEAQQLEDRNTTHPIRESWSVGDCWRQQLEDRNTTHTVGWVGKEHTEGMMVSGLDELDWLWWLA